MSGHLLRLWATPSGRPLTPTTNAVVSIRHPPRMNFHSCEWKSIRSHAHGPELHQNFHSYEWNSRWEGWCCGRTA